MSKTIAIGNRLRIYKPCFISILWGYEVKRSQRAVDVVKDNNTIFMHNAIRVI